jgi:ATP-binding cassette subfamily C protein
MRLIADALGIQLRSAAPGTPETELLDGIARASRVRLRHVHLRDGWWRTESGPLLGSRADEGTPVALLPSGPGRYVLVDPVDGRRSPVTPDLAGTLASTAVMLYRPFPDRALRALDLLRFGLFGGRRDLLVTVVAGLAASLLALIVPLASGYAFDVLMPDKLKGTLLLLGVGLVVAAFTSAGLSLLQGFVLTRAESRSDAAVQAAIWDRLLGLPPTFFRRFEVGDLGNRAMAIAGIRQIASSTVLASAMGVGQALSSLGLLVAFDVRLGLLALVLVALHIGLLAWGGLIKLRRQRTASAIEGKLSAMALELIGGITRLRVAGAEARGLARWAHLLQTYRAAMLRAGLASTTLAAWSAAFSVLVNLALFIAVAPGGGVTLDVGSYVAVAAAFAQCIGAIGALATSALTLLEAVPLYERARPILQARPEASALQTHPGRLTGAVRLEHVSFRYRPDGPLILDDVSLEIRPGESLAVVGPSGSGKSTLLRLLLGFERPERGRVLYDGNDLAAVDAREVRRQIGVVLQDGAVTADSILRNIVGAAPLTVQDAWEAARLAGFDTDIRGLPMGMYTRVPEGGASFSGGQRQRLMIARALVRRPRLVYFDEATSALDNATQAVVSGSLDEIGASRVLIAHRLSTVQHADQIVVLSGGRVVQRGRYEELAEQDGLFSELARRQVV